MISPRTLQVLTPSDTSSCKECLEAFNNRLALNKTSRVASCVLNLANKFVFFFLDEDRELLMSQHGKPDAVLSLVYVVYIEKTISVFEQRSLVSNVFCYIFSSYM